MATKETVADFNIDALLDGTLDDLADMPTFAPFPVGAHHAKISWQTQDRSDAKKRLVVNGHPAIQLNLVAIKTVELPPDSEEQPLVAGSETSVLFMMDQDYGQGAFKEIMKALAGHYGPASNRELMEKSKDAECLIVTNKREDKKNPGRFYTGIENLQVL